MPVGSSDGGSPAAGSSGKKRATSARWQLVGKRPTRNTRSGPSPKGKRVWPSSNTRSGVLGTGTISNTALWLGWFSHVQDYLGSHTLVVRREDGHRVRYAQGGGGRKKIPGTGVQLFFQGVPPEGEGGTKKKFAQKFGPDPKT